MKGKILVVDDEETTRLTLADILRLEEYLVQTVANGVEAIDFLKRETFDLILLDLKMPGVDGIDVLRKAVQIAPDTMVIFLTAHGSLESAIEALRQNVADYLLKPATPHQILNSVAAAMERRNELLRKRLLLEQLGNSLRELHQAEGIEAVAPVEYTLRVNGDILYDPSRRNVYDQGRMDKQVHLTQTEGKLFQVLLENRSHAITHRQLVQLVQGYEVEDWEAPEVLRPVISRLRRKLANFPGGEKWIVNVRGSGYVMD